MSSFLLDENGDLDTENNALKLTEGIDAIRQHLFEKFRLYLGEYFLDTSVGVPWYQEILVKAPVLSVVQERLKATILETPGVLELTRFAFDFNPITREADLDFQVRVTGGFIDFSQIVEI